MAQRLVEIYQPGEVVEVFFAGAEDSKWRPARVLGSQHPGVWVQTEGDRRLWFVTNGKRIRPLSPGPHPEAS
jgi:hypothetical protein